MSNKDYAKVAKREKTFATLAEKEGKSNKKLAEKAKGANKKDLEWESDVDLAFAKLRRNKARTAKMKEKQ